MAMAEILNNTKRLDIWLRNNRKNGNKIIFTNGCYDIIHMGHIKFLNKLRESYDKKYSLLVALNNDISIQRIKGPDRPVNNLRCRATVMAALRHIDAVTAFGDDTPGRLIEYVRPDVLAKGGDYSNEVIVGEDFVKSYGGKVYKNTYVEGVSSSRIIGILMV